MVAARSSADREIIANGATANRRYFVACPAQHERLPRADGIGDKVELLSPVSPRMRVVYYSMDMPLLSEEQRNPGSRTARQIHE
jgi:hypothetical protein